MEMKWEEKMKTKGKMKKENKENKKGKICLANSCRKISEWNSRIGREVTDVISCDITTNVFFFFLCSLLFIASKEKIGRRRIRGFFLKREIGLEVCGIKLVPCSFVIYVLLFAEYRCDYRR